MESVGALGRGALCLVVAAAALIFSWGCATIPSAHRAPSSTPSASSFGVAVGEARVQVEVADTLQPDTALIRPWIEAGVQAVQRYYGRFPVSRLNVHIESGGHPGVLGGKSFGYPSPLVRLTVGQNTSAAQFQRDWMLTHELIHLAFPTVPDHQVWAQEGLATYVEPLARFALGQVPARQVWKEMMEGMHKGVAALGAAGLDENSSWAATYWGGALFWFLADIEIRKNSGNHQSLQQALRAILEQGGTSQANWPLDKTLRLGDAVLTQPVLFPLYERLRKQPQAIDLEALWRQLGVRLFNGEISFDDDASLSSIRRAIAG